MLYHWGDTKNTLKLNLPLCIKILARNAFVGIADSMNDTMASCKVGTSMIQPSWNSFPHNKSCIGDVPWTANHRRWMTRTSIGNHRRHRQRSPWPTVKPVSWNAFTIVLHQPCLTKSACRPHPTKGLSSWWQIPIPFGLSWRHLTTFANSQEAS